MRQRQVQLISCRILSQNISSAQPDGIDIALSVQRIDLYESIFQNTISGNIVVTENVGLTELMPMVGIEFLHLVFTIVDGSGNNKTYNRMFRITKVHDEAFIRYDNRTYVIEFVTPEFFASVSKRISRRFQMSCSEAVQTIVNEELHDKTVSAKLYSTFVPPSPLPTWGTVDIVIPNYAPLRAINYFTMLSLEAKDRTSGGYLFFETLEGLHFTSIRKLIDVGKSKTVPTFFIDDALTASDPADTDRQRNSIFRLHKEQTFDLLTGVASGMYRSRAFHFDVLAQKFRGHNIKSTDSFYTDTFKQTSNGHLNAYQMFPEYYENEFSPNIRQFMIPTNVWSTANQQTIVGRTALENEQLMHESIVARNRQLREVRQLESLLEMPGQPNVHAGSVVRIIYPTTRVLSETNTTPHSSNPATQLSAHSGYHLVSSVHHTIVVKTPGEFDYRMSLRVSNDSLSRPLNAKSVKPSVE
jgi:hypothetical protein